MTDAPTTDAPVIVDNVEQARHLIAELSAPDVADTLDDGSLIAETVAALEALIDALELAEAPDGHRSALLAVLEEWAQPDPGMLSKLPKPTRRDNPPGRCDVCNGWHGLPAVHLDYMGHADVTEAMLKVDPFWNWRPAAIDDRTGAPVSYTVGSTATMWGYLTLLGVERMCVGTAPANKEEVAKELIGDLLRNGAMRFGIGLRLWSKADHLDATGDAENELAATTGVVDRSQPTEPPAQRARQDRADDARAQVAGELLAAQGNDRAPGEGRADLEAVANTGPLKNKAIRMARPLAAAAGIELPSSFAELLEMDAVAGSVAVLILEDIQKGS